MNIELSSSNSSESDIICYFTSQLVYIVLNVKCDSFTRSYESITYHTKWTNDA